MKKIFGLLSLLILLATGNFTFAQKSKSPPINMEREVNKLIAIADTATTCEQGWEYANKINYIVNNGGSVPLAMAKTHVEKANQAIADLSTYLKCK